MGYICHNAIIVTGTYGNHIDKAHTQAATMFNYVSDIVESPCNGTQSFFIPPDGSKEGWAESATGDSVREAYIKWLDKQRYEDGSSPLSWALIKYGDDYREAEILAHNNEEARIKAANTESTGGKS